MSDSEVRACRACLATNVKLHNLDGDSKEVLGNLTGLPVVATDGYPQQICSMCLYMLHRLLVFRKICQSALNTLQQMYANNIEITTDSLAQKDQRHLYNLRREGVEVMTIDASDPLANAQLKLETHVETTEAIMDKKGADNEKLVYEFVKVEDKQVIKIEIDSTPNEEENTGNEFYTCELVQDKEMNIIKSEIHPENSECNRSVNSEGNETSSSYDEPLQTLSNKKNNACKDNSAKGDLTDEKLKVFTCSVCNQNFVSRDTFVKHQKVHSNKKHLTCDICHRVFARLRNLRNHKFTHTKVKPFTCNICHVNFVNSASLQKHNIIHRANTPYICHICNKICSQRSHLKVHLRTHIGKYSCNLCCESFSDKESLDYHQLEHSNEKQFSCELCNKNFSRKYYLDAHKRRIHLGENKKLYFCRRCGKNFVSKNAHLKYHKILEQPHTCGYCNKRFAYKSYLDVHLRMHTGEKPFPCEICNKRFTKSYNLNKHMKTHS